MNLCRYNIKPHISTCFILQCRRSITTSQWKKYLSILRLDANSSTKEIKDSFLKLSKLYHPDNKSTGSHAKFVELKEAYDALKDGHPTSTSYSKSQYPKNPYDEDLSHKAHVKYRDTYQNWGTGGYSGQSPGASFGGTRRETAWDAHARERQYRKHKADWDSFGQRRPFSSHTNVTIFLGAISWIVIYSSILFIWDYNDAIKRGLSKYNAKNYDDYIAYEEYLKRKEQRKLFKLKDNNSEESSVVTDPESSEVKEDS